jgi:hypothetical protein
MNVSFDQLRLTSPMIDSRLAIPPVNSRFPHNSSVPQRVPVRFQAVFALLFVDESKRQCRQRSAADAWRVHRPAALIAYLLELHRYLSRTSKMLPHVSPNLLAHL